MKTHFPVVSVIVVTFNHSLFIREALKSILNQSVYFNVEILIGDDCSTDETRDIIFDVINDNQNLFFNFKYFRHKQNVGISNNALFLLNKAKAKYIAFCDGDDFWINENKLTLQVDTLEKNKHINIVAGHHIGNQNFDFKNKSNYLTGPDFFFDRNILLLSMMIRNFHNWPKWLSKVYPFDKFIVLIAANFKPIIVLNENLVFYRYNCNSITKKKTNASQTFFKSNDHFFGLKKVEPYFISTPYKNTYEITLIYFKIICSFIGKSYTTKIFIIIKNTPFLIKNFRKLNISKFTYLFFYG